MTASVCDRMPSCPFEENLPSPTSFRFSWKPHNVLTALADERLSLKERTFRYCRSTVRNDYWDQENLPHERPAVKTFCNQPKCKENQAHDDASRRAHGADLALLHGAHSVWIRPRSVA